MKEFTISSTLLCGHFQVPRQDIIILLLFDKYHKSTVELKRVMHAVMKSPLVDKMHKMYHNPRNKTLTERCDPLIIP